MDKSLSNPYATPATISELPTALFRSVDDEITLEFEVTKEDIQQYYQFQHLHHPQWKKVYQRNWFRVTAIFAVGGLIMLNASPGVGVGFLVLAALYGVGFPWLYRRRSRKTAELVLTKGRNLGLLGGRRIQLSRQGMYAHTAASEAIIYWPSFELVSEFKDAIYLYISAASAIVIPGRVFDSPEQKEEFLAYIHKMCAASQATVA